MLAERTARVLVVPDLRNAGEPRPQRLQPRELPHLLPKHALQQVQQLVDHEVHQSQVAVVPPLHRTLRLVVAQDRHYLARPVEAQRFLLLGRERGARGDDKPQHCAAEIVPALDAVDPDAVGESAPAEVRPARPLHHVADHCRGTSHHEVLVAEEGQVADHPVRGLAFAEPVPLVGREEVINIGHVQVLAEQATDLRLAPQRVVADCQRPPALAHLPNVRSHLQLKLFIVLFFSGQTAHRPRPPLCPNPASPLCSVFAENFLRGSHKNGGRLWEEKQRQYYKTTTSLTFFFLGHHAQTSQYATLHLFLHLLFILFLLSRPTKLPIRRQKEGRHETGAKKRVFLGIRTQKQEASGLKGKDANNFMQNRGRGQEKLISIISPARRAQATASASAHSQTHLNYI